MDDFIARLGRALKELHRSPGQGNGWVTAVLRKMEKQRPEDYERLRRRLGFAGRLAEMAGLTAYDSAAVELGVFFDNLIGEPSAGRAPDSGRTWSDYLLRNEDWLAPAFQVAQFLRVPPEDDLLTGEIARAALAFDIEVFDRGFKSLQAIQDLNQNAQTLSAQRVGELLLSEDGQELCDLHVRHLGQQYPLEPEEITQALEVLRRARTPDAPAANGGRVSLSLREFASGPKGPLKNVQKEKGGEAWANFERRREGFRSAASHVDEPVPPAKSVAPIAPVGPSDEPDEPKKETARDIDLFSMVRAESNEEPPTPPKRTSLQEDIMQIARSPLGNLEGQDWDLASKLESLQARLDQIAKVAEEGQQLVASLVPQLTELSTWMTELDTIVSRWKGNRPRTDVA